MKVAELSGTHFEGSNCALSTSPALVVGQNQSALLIKVVEETIATEHSGG